MKLVILWGEKGRIQMHGSTDVEVRKSWSEFRCLKASVGMPPVSCRIITKELEIGYKLTN